MFIGMGQLPPAHKEPGLPSFPAQEANDGQRIRNPRPLPAAADETAWQQGIPEDAGAPGNAVLLPQPGSVPS